MINNIQVWPSGPNELYTTWNQEGFIDNLLDAGYDIVIARFTPPNADIRLNADRLETLINLINDEKFSNGSYEENIVLGYSAGALCAKLALQRMEKKHLDHGGKHPHTKLFISFDGENQGANIPLAIQHAVNYLEEYQSGPLQFKIYALHYLLNAPLTKQLLKYFHSESGTTAQPAQGHHWLRDHYLYEHAYANHSKNTHLPGYPSFTRNVSVSNGSNESDITGIISNHFPYPSIENYPLYTQINNRREWHAKLSGTMDQRVFSYRKKPLFGSWSVEMEAVTAPDCLVLDNAPGGIIFIEQNSNPLVNVLKLMKSKINIGQPQIYNLHTLFSFTPTLFTHDIRNFNAVNTNYRMDYSMKANKLLYQNIDDADAEILNNQSDYWGYPHLAYPNTHYWEVTPFDVVFSWSVNTEHITFSEAIKDSPTSPSDVWREKYSSSKGIVKNFLLDETDFHNAFIQNKQYGWYARDNYVYRAEVNAKHEIYAGVNVTQRTDFKSAEVLSNADITFRAGQAIYLKLGTHIHAGATFHAVIENNACDLNGRPANGAPNSDANKSTNISEKTAKNQVQLESEKITIYPNPSNGEFCIQAIGEINTESPLEYWVFDTTRKKIAHGMHDSNCISLPLNKGLYILKLKKDEKISSHKIGIH